MQDSQLSQISSFIWNTADTVLRDIFSRGKYRDVILPMTVIRRLDAMLEKTKEAVLEQKNELDKLGIADQEGPLQLAAGQQFYNASPFNLRDLRNATSQQQLRDNFIAYLDGFSPNVQDILEKFDFRNQIGRLSSSNGLDRLIERYLTRDINFSPEPVLNEDESIRLPGLDNHAMGTIFEDLLRRFNEENNEEAGEHWTPRDAVELMAKLVFLPVEDQIQSSSYVLYDGALGTGGMLTIAEDTLRDIAGKGGHKISTHLYGQEINDETFAICKADLLLKGETDAGANIVGGPEYSTLSNDVFKNRKFDFMLSNPPYGKNWKTDQDRMGGKKLNDPRFLIQHADDPEYSLVTRVSDGQLMFLANMVGKMRDETPLGSRIAEVHNGSSLFTGDAGQGESNIRRWIIENDWLEAIVALPLNMFYNTGNRHLRLDPDQPEAGTPQRPRPANQRHRVVPAPSPEPGAENPGTFRRGHPAHLRNIHGLRGNRRVEDFPQRSLRVLEGNGGAAAQAGGHRPGTGIQACGNQEAEGREATGARRAGRHQKNPRRGPRSNTAPRNVRSNHQGQESNGGVRARPGPPGHGADSTAPRGRALTPSCRRKSYPTRPTPGTHQIR